MNEEIVPDIIEKEKKDRISNSKENELVIHLLSSFRSVCMVTAALPLLTLFTCFVTAYVFQYDEVHETHCRVYNIIPSISAITGVSPQRYFWRMCVALHIGPRFPLTFMYKNYYNNLLLKQYNYQSSSDLYKKTKFLIQLAFWLHNIELVALGGVTYVSNKENYPVHEKIFITFMVCSLCHMLVTIKLYGTLHPSDSMTKLQIKSLKWKKLLFAVSILSTIGLFLFFLKHRLFCHDLAFSGFSLCEYIIASANMVFHCTTMWDFPCEYLIIAKCDDNYIKQHILTLNSNNRINDKKID